jgi:hypothetical protein
MSVGDFARNSFVSITGAIGIAWGIGVLFLISYEVWSAATAPGPTPAELAAKQQRELTHELAAQQQRELTQAQAQAQREREAQSQRERKERERLLCLEARACKKYSEARLDCATAGNFKTCLRIKMGEDSFYGDMCSGYDVGAPAVALPPDTPNTFQCFFVLNFK